MAKRERIDTAEHADLTRTFEARAFGRGVPVEQALTAGTVLSTIAEQFQHLKRRLHAVLAAEDVKRRSIQAAEAAGTPKAQRDALPKPRGQAEIKRSFLAEHRIPGRLHNAIEGDLLGLHKAVREGAAFQVGQVTERIESIGRKLSDLRDTEAKARVAWSSARSASTKEKAERRLGRLANAQHQKTRKRISLEQRKRAMEARAAMTVPPVCFGSRRLFAQQHELADNGYADHTAWQGTWRESRCDQFVVKGSHEEVAGNKTCKAVVQDDAALDPQGRGRPSLTLHLLVPEGLRAADADGKAVTHLVLPGIRFGHGYDEVVAAIRAANTYRPTTEAFQRETKRLVGELLGGMNDATEEEREEAEKALRNQRNALAKQMRDGLTGAITWRFVRQTDGWRVLATVTRRHPTTVASFGNGAMGVDLNERFVALMAVDAFGNPLPDMVLSLPMNLVGLRAEQVEAVLGDLVARIVDLAEHRRCPLVIEDLDFAKKKAALKETVGPQRARRFSAFAYATFRRMLLSRAGRRGVRVIGVNPAFSSHIGRCLWARRLGITVHHAACVALARRGMELREPAPKPWPIPVGDGRHVTPGPLAKMGRRHVWRSWGKSLAAYRVGIRALDEAASGRRASARPGMVRPAPRASARGGPSSVR